MLRKNYLTILLAVVLFLTGSLAAFAQTAPVRGKVELKKADGTLVPVADAVVDVYRIDIAGKPSPSKTNKKGEFSFAGLPLGESRQRSPAVMVNLLGDIWCRTEHGAPDWAGVLAVPGAALHLYGKRAPRRGRKMGHVTCTADDLGEALRRANEVARVLAMPGFE